MLTKEEKESSTQGVKVHPSDTGSSAVQVSIFSARIQKLSDHLKKNRKDTNSRKGLVDLVEQRRKHLSYLKRKDVAVYENTIKTLGLRK